MKLKSYFTESVEAAVQLARKELGDEALLVNARPATPETRHLGAYEVVFGSEPGPRPVRAEAPHADRLTQDVADLKRGFEQMAQSLRGSRMFAAPAALGEAELYSRLISNELDPVLAQSVADGTPLEQLFETDPTLGRPGAKRSVVALVGPPGVGKTTTLMKLAARYGLA